MDFTLGAAGLKVSKLGFGCMGITAYYGASMEDEPAIELLKAVYDMGYRHFDSAEAYKSETKHNEEQLALFFKTVPRDSYTVATKFMPFMHEGEACDLESLTQAVDASLARLGLDYVDLYYCHRPPSTLEKAEQWMASMKEIVKSGKVRHVGLSEFSPDWVRKLHAIHPVAAIQIEWSLVTRNLVEEFLLDCCKELGIGVVAYSPLARNLLAAAPVEVPTDWRAAQPRYSEENLKQNQELLKKIEAMAEAKSVTAAQLSLAWLYFKAEQLGLSMIAIPGTTKIANAKTNLASLGVALTPEDAAALEALASAVAGDRGNERYLTMSIEGNMTKST
ncbi:unnamed protein product [Effrenium voratum]|uniref:NADP-dependent oxidoreductase domain-containing protein n=1 Tax=Effrenium voratum TaxID=2562239 RepID=A0AA36IGA2_9DINO|nr:unnamed protein product [Effrenium voratum]